MARKRTDMSKIKDILRLRFDAGLSLRDISKCCSVGPATVSEILSRFATSGLSWPLLGETSETELEKAVYKGKNSSRHKRQPDFALMHQELKRKGMTKSCCYGRNIVTSIPPRPMATHSFVSIIEPRLKASNAACGNCILPVTNCLSIIVVQP